MKQIMWQGSLVTTDSQLAHFLISNWRCDITTGDCYSKPWLMLFPEILLHPLGNEMTLLYIESYKYHFVNNQYNRHYKCVLWNNGICCIVFVLAVPGDKFSFILIADRRSKCIQYIFNKQQVDPQPHPHSMSHVSSFMLTNSSDDQKWFPWKHID